MEKSIFLADDCLARIGDFVTWLDPESFTLGSKKKFEQVSYIKTYGERPFEVTDIDEKEKKVTIAIHEMEIEVDSFRLKIAGQQQFAKKGTKKTLSFKLGSLVIAF